MEILGRISPVLIIFIVSEERDPCLIISQTVLVSSTWNIVRGGLKCTVCTSQARVWDPPHGEPPRKNNHPWLVHSNLHLSRESRGKRLRLWAFVFSRGCSPPALMASFLERCQFHCWRKNHAPLAYSFWSISNTLHMVFRVDLIEGMIVQNRGGCFQWRFSDWWFRNILPQADKCWVRYFQKFLNNGAKTKTHRSFGIGGRGTRTCSRVACLWRAHPTEDSLQEE